MKSELTYEELPGSVFSDLFFLLPEKYIVVDVSNTQLSIIILSKKFLNLKIFKYTFQKQKSC